MTDMQNIEIQRSLRNILSGNRVGFDPSDADKEALKLLDDNLCGLISILVPP